MKSHLSKFLLAALCVAAMLSCSSGGPKTYDKQEVPERGLGVFRVYPDVDSPATVSLEGYEPFYISHYGRHGSRYLQDELTYTSLLDLFSAAYDDDMLTLAGKKVYNDLKEVYPSIKGNTGMLTAVGAEQHRAIAGRMVENYPSVFTDTALVYAGSSSYQRTIDSRDAFCATLSEHNPGLRIVKYTDATLNPWLPEAGLSNEEDNRNRTKHAVWNPEYEVYRDSLCNGRALAGRLFKDVDYAASNISLSVFQLRFAQIAAHFKGIGADIDWFRYLTKQELLDVAACSAYRFYMQKGPVRSGRPWALSVYLIDRMLKEAEADMAEGVVANLRFGHDGCLTGMLCMMEADGWFEKFDTDDGIAHAWDMSQIPMACNFQWIFYRPTSGEGDIYVQFLMNEKPLKLGILDEEGLCRWPDFKAYMDGRCAAAYKILAEE